MSLCRIFNLGIIEYSQSLQLQSRLASARLANKIPDTILLLEHFPVITIGAAGREGDILISRDLLEDEGISVCHTDRGGAVTYHGLGQLVGYLIFDLKARGKDIHLFVHNIEEAIIRTLKHFSISAYIAPLYPGVWVGQDKVCALGIRVSHWISQHGFALNVNTDLRPFNFIVPCGISDRRVTSMSQLLGHDIALEDVTTCLLEQFAEVFDLDIKQEPAEESKSLLCPLAVLIG